MSERLGMLDFDDAKGIYNLNPGVCLRTVQTRTFAESLIVLNLLLAPRIAGVKFYEPMEKRQPNANTLNGLCKPGGVDFPGKLKF